MAALEASFQPPAVSTIVKVGAPMSEFLHAMIERVAVMDGFDREPGGSAPAVPVRYGPQRIGFKQAGPVAGLHGRDCEPDGKRAFAGAALS